MTIKIQLNIKKRNFVLQKQNKNADEYIAWTHVKKLDSK